VRANRNLLSKEMLEESHTPFSCIFRRCFQVNHHARLVMILCYVQLYDQNGVVMGGGGLEFLTQNLACHPSRIVAASSAAITVMYLYSAAIKVIHPFQ
jgi:hypothetical protein